MKIEVLIVDDDNIVLFIHQTLIKKAKVCDAPHSFHSCIDALDYIKKSDKNIPALIFLDINLPLMNGWDFIEKMQEEIADKKVFVLITTSSIDENDKNRALSFEPVIGFIEKPMKLDDLLELKNNELLADYFTP